MFKLFVITTLVALAAAAVVHDNAHAEATLVTSDVRADGFDSALEISNNIHQKASGDAKGNIQGDFSWVAPGGEHVKVSYVANEHGYQPVSDFLPTSPPIPAAILKAIEYIKAHPTKEASHH